MCIYFLENIKCINFILYSIQTGTVPVLVTATFISLKLFIIIVLFFRKPTRPSLPLRKAPPFSPSLSSIVFTPPSVPPVLGDRNPQGREDVTALRCSEPLRYKVGGPKRSSPCFAGWDRRKTEYLYNELTVKILISTYNILKYQNAILLNFRLVSIFLTYSLET